VWTGDDCVFEVYVVVCESVCGCVSGRVIRCVFLGRYT
jgi:hypothetical protein